jgi:5'-3' exonuclease
MGIKGLGSYLKIYGIPRNIKDLANSRICIDTAIYMFKFKYLSNTEQFLNKFSEQVGMFAANNITPIYVFDGPHPVEKKETQEKRRETQSIFITKEEIALLKKNFSEAGVNWVVAPGEAEKLCSYMNREEITDYVLSNDYDTLVFGARKVITCQKNQFVEFGTDTILRYLELSHPQFIDICLAAGCDFFPGGIPMVGVIKAVKLAKAGIPIEKWAKNSEEFLANYPKIKSIFTDFAEEKELCKTDLFAIKEIPHNSAVESFEKVSVPETTTDDLDD